MLKNKIWPHLKASSWFFGFFGGTFMALILLETFLSFANIKSEALFSDLYNYSFILQLIETLLFVIILIPKQIKNKNILKPIDIKTFSQIASWTIVVYFIVNIFTALMLQFMPTNITKTYTVDEIVSQEHSAILTIFSTAFAAPIMEEIIFRYGIQGSLMKLRFKNTFLQKLAPFYAITVQAFVFGVCHGNLIQGLYAFVCGFILGFIYYKTSNLSYTLIAHIIFNSIPLLITYIGSNVLIGLLPAAVLILIIVKIITPKDKIANVSQ